MEKKTTKLKKVEAVGVILRPSTPEIKESYKEIENIFISSNIEVFLEKESADMLKKETGLHFDDLCRRVDFLVSLGGDGTLISTARKAFKHNIATLGVHLGTLGFLTDIKLEELAEFLKNLKDGNYRVDKRAMIKGSIKGKEIVAFNDIVISRKSMSNMLKVNAIKKNKLFNTYYGDGLIISTPTGSTAYNLSSGGPILHPQVDAFVLTPVAPHSLTQRPLVLPKNFKLEFQIPDSLGATVIVDGQDTYNLEQGDIIKIEFAKRKAKLINRAQRDYFEVLNNKLQWGN